MSLYSDRLAIFEREAEALQGLGFDARVNGRDTSTALLVSIHLDDWGTLMFLPVTRLPDTTEAFFITLSTVEGMANSRLQRHMSFKVGLVSLIKGLAENTLAEQDSNEVYPRLYRRLITYMPPEILDEVIKC